MQRPSARSHDGPRSAARRIRTSRRLFLVVAALAGVSLAVAPASSAAPASPWHTAALSVPSGVAAIYPADETSGRTRTACAAARVCYGVETPGGDSLLIQRDGDQVGAVAVPRPATSGADDSLVLEDVACGGPSWCVAVGVTFAATSTGCCLSGLVTTIVNGHAVSRTVPPSADYDSLVLTQVSCPAVGECFAVGEQRTTSATGATLTATPILAHLHGGAWTIQQLPSAAFWVDCPSTTWCTLLGDHYVTTVNDGLVTQRSLPVPAGYHFSEVDGLDCASEDACAAVGAVQRIAEPFIVRPIVWNVTNSYPHFRLVPLPGDHTTGHLYKAIVDTVACPSAGHCFAGGFYAATSPGSSFRAVLTELRDGVLTSRTFAPLPDGGTRPTTVTAMSCAYATRCDVLAAVGRRVADQIWNGSSWRPLRVPDLAGHPANSALSLSSIACVTGTCFALGGELSDEVEEEGYQTYRLVYSMR